MNHNDKLKKMYQHLPALGISPYTAAPPLYRLLWLLGIESPPPIFASFLQISFYMGTFFAFGWGLFMWFLFWSNQEGPSPSTAFLMSLLAGATFGLFMAAYLRYIAKKHNLPSWSDYKGE